MALKRGRMGLSTEEESLRSANASAMVKLGLVGWDSGDIKSETLSFVQFMSLSFYYYWVGLVGYPSVCWSWGFIINDMMTHQNHHHERPIRSSHFLATKGVSKIWPDRFWCILWDKFGHRSFWMVHQEDFTNSCVIVTGIVIPGNYF